MIEGTRVSSPASIFTRMRRFSLGDSRWYTTSKRRSRAGQSTAVMSMKLMNWQRSSSRKNVITLTMSRALAVTMLVMAWLSTGALLIVNGEGTSIPGPWMLLFDVPLFDSVLESRFALGCVPVIGILLARATEKVLRLRVRPDWRYTAIIAWCSMLVLALLPIAPTELKVAARGETPTFFTSGEWRRYVDDGSVVPMGT